MYTCGFLSVLHQVAAPSHAPFPKDPQKGASCSVNCIMPENRLIDAHLLHPHASMPIPGSSNAFIEEAHVQ